MRLELSVARPKKLHAGRALLSIFSSASIGLAQPLHGEFDILRLQVAPAPHLGLVAVLGEALKVFRRKLSGSHTLPSEFLADEWVFGHRADRQRVRAGMRHRSASRLDSQRRDA